MRRPETSEPSGEAADSLRLSQRDEWPANLSAGQLEQLGWQPVGFNEFVLKIHSRCNLACDYCYIYEMGDTSWRRQPGSMTLDTARQICRRIKEHCADRAISRVGVVLHGGEPLLVPAGRLAALLDVFESELRPNVAVTFGIQTNGLLLDSRRTQLLSRYDVEIGVSLDGDALANDRHRKLRTGGGTYDRVAERLTELLAGEHSYLLGGFLATVDLCNDPIEVYETLAAFSPKGMDFLLPHANWSRPPVGVSEDRPAPYGEWLVRLFDHWWDDPGRTEVRTFTSAIRLLRGDFGSVESMGVQPNRMAVIETDGSYELVDVLKSAYNGAATTGLNVFDNSLDDLERVPSLAVRQTGLGELCATCRTCSLVEVCGGGYFPHRYRKGSGFWNPSVYCADLALLFRHIQGRVL